MNKYKLLLLFILILIAFSILFRGWIYRNFITYKSLGIRQNIAATSPKLTEYLQANIDKNLNNNVEQIIKVGLSLTSGQLYFTTGKNSVDPNQLIHLKAAHCVGYASFFSTTCNYLLKKHGFSGEWSAKIHIGKLYFLGVNIHQYFNSSFFKDHDFVVIENKNTGQQFAVDPTMNDYLYIDFISFIKE
jgi:hypothetical protein